MKVLFNDKDSRVSDSHSRLRLIAAVLAFCLYFALCYLLSSFTYFTGLPILSVIPIIAVSWLYGARIGVVAGVLAFPVNAFMLSLVGIDWVDNMVVSGGGFAGGIGLVLIGLVVGRLSELSRRLGKELHARQIAEKELLAHRENLEQLVNDKVRDLQETQERFKAVTENSPDAIIITDLYGINRYCNRGAEQMFGYTCVEMLGQNSIMFLPPCFHEDEQRRRDSLIQKDKVFEMNASIESTMVRKDGSEFPVEFSLYSWALRDETFFSMIIRDITHRRQAEAAMAAATEELQRSRDFFQNVFDVTGDGMYVTDEMGSIVFANTALARMLGYDHEELIGMSAIDLSAEMSNAPDSVDKEQELFNRDYNEPFEAVFIHKDGSYLTVESRLTNLIEGDHLGSSIVVSLRDITERKKAEEEISQARDFMEAMFRASPDAIIAVDVAGNITAANDSVYDVFGYRAHELIGRPVHEIPIDSSESRASHHGLIEQLHKHGIVRNFEEKRAHKDGQTLYVETSIAVLKNSDGSPAGAISSSRDITGRKLLEEQLQRSRDTLEKIFMASPDAIIVADDSGIITMASDSVYDVYGYQPDELIGLHGSMLSPPDNEVFEKTKEVIEELYEKGFVANAVYERLHKDGYKIWGEASYVLLRDADGSVSGTVSSTRDITERMRMEEQSRQTQKMEAIGTLAGGIAHDFNNILSAIIGYTELSQQEASCDALINNNLEQVLKAAGRARNLVKQILEFSRKSQYEVRAVQVDSILKEALKLLRASIPATVEIQIEIANAGDVVMADSTQIHQVIMNLCTNAVHAMENGGGILTIGLKRVVLQDFDTVPYEGIAAGQYLQLSVRDTGDGIDPDTMARVFEPFFTTKSVDKGTGMGLAVVHGIVKSLKGAVTVYSDPGRGTVFHVLFPVTTGSVQVNAADEQDEARGSENVLLVDDEAALMDVGANMLRSLGYQVTATQNPQEAFKVFSDDPSAFDLVFTDQVMPELTGFELAQRMIDLRSDIPVILCTGYSDLVTEKAALAAGIKAFVTKPFTRHEISKTIRDVLE